MKIEGIIFDMDGLVFDSERIWQKAFLEANRVFKVPLTEDYRISICGKDEKSIRYELHKMFPSLDENAYRDYMLDFVNNYIEKNAIPLKDSFIEIITYCQQYNLKTALSTASGKRRAESMFNKVGLDVNEVFNNRL